MPLIALLGLAASAAHGAVFDDSNLFDMEAIDNSSASDSFSGSETAVPGVPDGPKIWELLLIGAIVVGTIGAGCLFLSCSRTRKRHPPQGTDETAGEPLLVPVEYF
jgi:hypothetical protein